LTSNFNLSESYFTWKHNLKNSYLIEEKTFCIFFEKKCIASLQIIISEISINNKVYKFGLISDAVTHDSYRKLGLFEKLLNYSYDYFKAKDFIFFIASGNKKSRKVMLKLNYINFFGGIIARKRIRYSRILANPFILVNFYLRSTKLNKKIIEINKEQYIEFINNNQSLSELHFLKSKPYMDWRLKKPIGVYKSLAINENGILKAVFIVQINRDLIYLKHFFIINDEVKYLDEILKYVDYLAIKDKRVKKIKVLHNNFKGYKEIFNKNNYNLYKDKNFILLKYLKSDFHINQSQINTLNYMKIDKNE